MNPLSLLGSNVFTKAATAPTSDTTSTNSTTSSTSSSSSTSSTSSTDPAADAADRFLTLLVTQLQNQDPLNPLDNAQITTQLAQISTVSGINKLNDTVASLASAFTAGQWLQASGIIGHDVVTSGNGIDLASGAASGGISLASKADSVTISISDASGAVVRTINLGAQDAGPQFFTWDGKTDAGSAAPAGHYTFSATAKSGTASVGATTLSVAHVEGIVPGQAGVSLQLTGGTQIALSDIFEIR
ncbi:MAG TPA: flagellar hook assembly protein FlgD [Casimicrobiaceae bacterium]|nr:flagellar hook assembly protein FlgD [Casimicrobiaceae bacterium]